MNYRHAYHAGSFSDCLKHTLLIWLLQALLRKPTPLFVLDTHAGPGFTDLTGGPSARTGEWRRGIGRLLCDPPSPLTDYVDLVDRLGLYPGSPAIIRALLRPGDRLACCELHPEDHALLHSRYGRDPRVFVHDRDGFEALRALLPPKERRGLVLIDPPYEQPREFARLAAQLRTAHGRFRNGVFAAWYPVKHRTPVRAFHTTMQTSGIRDIVAAELCLREPLDPSRLNGCGMLLVNPPYRFESEIPAILQALLSRLADGEPGAAARLIRLADE
jgi:23S rRNA (adenine2030-N6)-methyltransferase